MATLDKIKRSLSKKESDIILELSWEEKERVTIDELRELVECSDSELYNLAHKLVRKGWLERLRPGLFQLVPAQRGVDGIPDSNPFIPPSILVEDGAFYSFGTACERYGFTDQHFMDMYLVANKKVRPACIRGKKYYFSYANVDKFFGFQQKKIFSNEVEMATAERALIDSIDKPKYAGGIGEVSNIIKKAATKISWDALINLLEKWDESAIVQRLGYLLDLHCIDITSDIEKKFHDLINTTNKIHLGSRAKWGPRGSFNQKWGIIENVPLEVLLGHHKFKKNYNKGQF